MRSEFRHCILWLSALLFAAPLGHTWEASNPLGREYHLRFYNTHTNERIDLVYRRGESYLTEALSKLDRYLRDVRSGEVHHFDPHLFDLLYDLTDIRLPGVPTTAVRDAALRLQRGGVGYYRDSNFVHVDVGPVRRW